VPPPRIDLLSALNLPGAGATDASWQRLPVASLTSASDGDGAPLPSAIASPRVLTNAMTPHRAMVSARSVGSPDGEVELLYRFLAPGSSAVIIQDTLTRLHIAPEMLIDTVLPPMTTESLAMDLQLLLLAYGCDVSSAGLEDGNLTPMPLALELRGAARQTEFAGADSVNVFASLSNFADRFLTPTIEVEVADGGGRVVYSEMRTIRLGARSYSSFAAHPDIPGPGNYVMTTRAVVDDRSLATSLFSFRVVEADRDLPDWRLREFFVAVRGAAGRTVFPEVDDVSIFISAISNTDAQIAPDAEMTVVDADGDRVAHETWRIRIAPRRTAHSPFNPTVRGRGPYRFQVQSHVGERDPGSGQFQFRIGPD